MMSLNCGATGAILIPDYAKGNKRASAKDMIGYALVFRGLIPENFMLGVNFLGGEIVSRTDLFDLEWFNILPKIFKLKTGVKVYGSAAFKYTPYEGLYGEDLKIHCLDVAEKSDVVVTSGTKTGMPPMVKKIKDIKSYIGSKPLAIASGVDSSNVKAMMDAGASEFLVATSILHPPGHNELDEFDPRKIEQLAKLILG